MICMEHQCRFAPGLILLPVSYIYTTKSEHMGLPVNDKKNPNKKSGSNKSNAGNSKFIKSASSSTKSPNVAKKIRGTGANRGS